MGNRIGKRSRLRPGELATEQAAALSGLTGVALRRWVGRGALAPRIEGTGEARVIGWSVRDVVAARAVAKLRRRLSAQRIRRVVDELRAMGRGLADVVLWTDGRDVQLVERDRIVELGSGQEGFRFVAVGECVAEVIAIAERDELRDVVREARLLRRPA